MGQGRLVNFTYTTDKEKKRAVIYEPYLYDAKKQYNIFYLMHGGGGNETTYMGSEKRQTRLKYLIDEMIEQNIIEPMIFVMPTFPTGTMEECKYNANHFYEEVRSYLIPAVETMYSTYAEDTTAAGLRASRMHRGFGGFSMGSVTTWAVLANALDEFAWFLPMSGDSWAVIPFGGGKCPKETAEYLNTAVLKQGYAAEDYHIYAATGSKDIAMEHLPPMIEEMKSQCAFLYTDNGFEDGNLMFVITERNYHDYPDTYAYIYEGLKRFFK